MIAPAHALPGGFGAKSCGLPTDRGTHDGFEQRSQRRRSQAFYENDDSVALFPEHYGIEPKRLCALQWPSATFSVIIRRVGS
jgi:hypothetical protein